jgi:hypothetical protein
LRRVRSWNLGKYIRGKRFKLDQRIIVFLFFLLISTVLWFLNELSKNSSSVISCPVKYINLPKNLVLVKDLPIRLNLVVQAPGYTLLKYKLSNQKVPLIINYNSSPLKEVTSGNSMSYYLFTSLIRDRISRQLQSDIQIIDISPDTLLFEFDQIVSKKIPVFVDLDLEYEKQFMLKGEITTEPDSIRVLGPTVILDTLQEVRTKYQKLVDINQPVTKILTMESIKNVTFSPRKVTINIPVEQFTEAKFDIDIETLNVPDTLDMKIFPRTISITFLVGLSDYNKLSPHLFRAVVDYESIEKSISNKLKVNLVKYPDYIISVHFHPMNVDYIIEN